MWRLTAGSPAVDRVRVLFGNGCLNMLQVHTIVFSLRGDSGGAVRERVHCWTTGRSDTIRAAHRRSKQSLRVRGDGAIARSVNTFLLWLLLKFVCEFVWKSVTGCCLRWQAAVSIAVTSFHAMKLQRKGIFQVFYRRCFELLSPDCTLESWASADRQSHNQISWLSGIFIQI